MSSPVSDPAKSPVSSESQPLSIPRPQPDYRSAQANNTASGALRRRLLLLVVAFLFISGTRILRFDQHEMDSDEIWSIWQTLGNPAQIVQWTPYDWTPTYYLFLGVWRGIVGIQPFALYALPFLQFLITEALLYRLARRLFNEPAAWLAVISFAALGFNFHLSVLIRAYGTILTLMVLSTWLAVRYFEHPDRKRGLLLAVPLSLMAYLHLTSIFGIGMLGLFSLILYPRKVRSWLWPGGAVIAASLPLLVWPKATGAVQTAAATLSVYSNPEWVNTILRKLIEICEDFPGYNLSMWAALLVFAGVLIVLARQKFRLAAALFLWLSAPAFLVLVAPVFGAFNTRHMAWVSIGLALWLGWGFSYLSAQAHLAVVSVLALGMLGSIPLNTPDRIPTTSVLRQMGQRAQWGDVAYINPHGLDVNGEEWEYYTQVYFPQGLTFVTNPAGHQRVWYIFDPLNTQSRDFEMAVQRGHVSMETIGTSGIVARLYEAPPDPQGVAFDNGMRFHGVEVADARGPIPAFHAGDPVHLRLWWSIDRPQALDYSVGTYVIDSSGLFAQSDSAPQVKDGPAETSRWVVGQYYIEDRTIAMPYPLKQNSLTIYLSVYFWQDQKRLTAPGVNKDNLLPVQPILLRHYTVYGSHS